MVDTLNLKLDENNERDCEQVSKAFFKLKDQIAEQLINNPPKELREFLESHPDATEDLKLLKGRAITDVSFSMAPLNNELSLSIATIGKDGARTINYTKHIKPKRLGLNNLDVAICQAYSSFKSIKDALASLEKATQAAEVRVPLNQKEIEQLLTKKVRGYLAKLLTQADEE